MKIAISSDNHLDVNRQNPDEIVYLQANYLNEQNVEYYLFAGDMFNDFFICIILTSIFLILIGVSLETMDGMIIVSPLL